MNDVLGGASHCTFALKYSALTDRQVKCVLDESFHVSYFSVGLEYHLTQKVEVTSLPLDVDTCIEFYYYTETYSIFVPSMFSLHKLIRVHKNDSLIPMFCHH
jgi:hypothetical protein